MAEPIKPAETPSWATDAGATIATPPGGKMATGWIAERPPFQFWNWLHYWTWQWILYFTSKLDILPGANADTTLTLTVGGVITPTQGNHALDTFAAAGAQDLNNILTTNLNDGRMLILHGINAAHVVTLKNAAGGAGQLHLALGLDLVLDAVAKQVTLRRIGADWYEVSRTYFDSLSGKNLTVITGTGTFAVPLTTSNIIAKILAPGGGSGGGGESDSGSGGGAAGTTGGDGGDCWVLNNTYKARGGKGGPGGSGGVGGYAGGVAPAGYAASYLADRLLYGTKQATSGNDGSAGVGAAGGAGADSFDRIVRQALGGAGGAQVVADSVGNPGTVGATYGAGAGAGGGGRYVDGTKTGGGGGAGGQNGEYAEISIPVTPGAVITVTLGAPGTAGVGGSGNPGQNGGAGAVGGAGIIVIYS